MYIKLQPEETKIDKIDNSDGTREPSPICKASVPARRLV